MTMRHEYDCNKMLHQWPFTLTFLFFLQLLAAQDTNNTQQNPNYRYACLDQSSTTPSTTYQANLNSLFSSLTSDSATSNGFSNGFVFP